MIPKLFVDSDVLIDVFSNRQPFVAYSLRILDLNRERKVVVHVSAVSINNIYYMIRKYIGHKKTIDLIRNIVTEIEIIGTSKSEIIQGINSGFADFEDSIQHATAISVKGMKAIITRNTADYKKSILPVFTPEGYIKAIT